MFVFLHLKTNALWNSRNSIGASISPKTGGRQIWHPHRAARSRYANAPDSLAGSREKGGESRDGRAWGVGKREETAVRRRWGEGREGEERGMPLRIKILTTALVRRRRTRVDGRSQRWQHAVKSDNLCLPHLHSTPPLGVPAAIPFGMEHFWRCVYSFWQNSRTWQTDRHTDGHRTALV